MTLASLFAVSLAALLCIPAAAGQYTVRDFVDEPRASVPYLSPDGRKVAMAVPDGDTTRLVVFDIAARKFTLSLGFTTDEHVGDFGWVSADRLVYNTVVKRGSRDGKLYTGNVYAVNFDGTRRTVLWGPDAADSTYLTIEDTLRDDDDHIIVSAYSFYGSDANRSRPIAYRIDVNQDLSRKARSAGSGLSDKPKRERLVTSPADNGVLIPDVRSGAWAAAGTDEATGLNTLFYRPGGSQDWIDLSALVRDDEEAELKGFLSDGRLVFVTDKPDGFDGLYAIEPKTRQRELLAGRGDVDIARVVMDYEDAGRVLAVEYLLEYPERQYLATTDPLVKLFAAVESKFPDDIVEVTSITRDRARALVYTWNDRNAGDAYLYDVATGHLQRLFNVRPNLDRNALALSEPIAYKARDGMTVRGYLTLPPGGKDNLPLVVLPHGGPHGVWDRWGWDPYDRSYYDEVQLLAHHGYAVLQPNFRGSGGYGTRFLSSGYRNWGTTMQDDLTDAVKWAVGKGLADPKRVCIYGASYGGYAALMSPIREPDLYKCAIGYVGVYDIPLKFEAGDVHKSASGRRYLEKIHGTDRGAQLAQSPVSFADRLKADLMLVVGERDRRVVPEHYERMAKALDKAGKKYEEIVKPKEGHGFADVENRVELYTKLLAFLQRNIGGADTRVAAPDPGPAKAP